MLNFCDFIQVYVFSTNHHLNITTVRGPLDIVSSSRDCCCCVVVLRPR